MYKKAQHIIDCLEKVMIPEVTSTTALSFMSHVVSYGAFVSNTVSKTFVCICVDRSGLHVSKRAFLFGFVLSTFYIKFKDIQCQASVM